MNIGAYVLVRSTESGCWAGTLSRRDGQDVTLTNARRLWRWWAAEGVSLSGVAATGLRADKLDVCRIAPAVTEALVFGCCEILAVTEVARASIEAQPARAS